MYVLYFTCYFSWKRPKKLTFLVKIPVFKLIIRYSTTSNKVYWAKLKKSPLFFFSWFWYKMVSIWSIRLIHGSIILCLLFLFTFLSVDFPFPSQKHRMYFYKQRWILIILCWRLNRLIYWWPSRSKNKWSVHLFKRDSLFVSWNFRQDF